MQLFTFAEVEAILASACNVASAKRTAFRSRLKALIGYGVPTDMSTGRGKPTVCNIDQLFQLGLAVELTRCGMAPQAAAEGVRHSWFRERLFLHSALLWLAKDTSAVPPEVDLRWVWQCSYDALADLTEPHVGKRVTPQIRSLSTAVFSRFSAWDRRTRREDERAVIVNSAVMIILILAHTKRQMKTYGVLEAIADLEELEPGLGELGGLMARDPKEFTTSEAELMAIADHYEGDDIRLRATEIALSPYAIFEISYLLTPDGLFEDGDLQEHAPEPDQPTAYNRERGQEQLLRLGLIAGLAPHRPRFTRLGAEYVKRFIGQEIPADVDPQA